MKNAPIPPFTLLNLTGAVGDVVRAAAAWGQADARGEDSDGHITLCMQCIAQLLTLALQREPSEGELLSVLGG